MKLNKEIKGLAKYVSEHVLIILNTVEKYKIKEKLEELVSELKNFREYDYDDEVNLLTAMVVLEKKGMICRGRKGVIGQRSLWEYQGRNNRANKPSNDEIQIVYADGAGQSTYLQLVE